MQLVFESMNNTRVYEYSVVVGTRISACSFRWDIGSKSVHPSGCTINSSGYGSK